MQISTSANGNNMEFGGAEGLYEDDNEENEVVIQIGQQTSEGQPSAAQQDQQVRQKTTDQLKNRQLLMGYHHNHLSPLPSNWVYPKQMTLIQLINLWLLVSPNKKTSRC